MIYLNQASTSWPKPKTVIKAVEKSLSIDPQTLKEKYHEAHENTCKFFNIPNPDDFLFTTSCTHALDLAMNHLNLKEGDKIITSPLEHYALSSTLIKWKRRGVVILKSPYSQETIIDLNWVEEKLKKNRVKLVAVCHGSNVTGELLPVSLLSLLARRHGALFLMDGAQTAGTMPVDLQKLNVDIFTFTGHKGMLGPQGIGGLYIDSKVDLISSQTYCDFEEKKSIDKLF